MTLLSAGGTCVSQFHPSKGSLPFVASSTVKLIEGWLSFRVDRNASAVSTFGIMLNVSST